MDYEIYSTVDLSAENSDAEEIDLKEIENREQSYMNEINAIDELCLETVSFTETVSTLQHFPTLDDPGVDLCFNFNRPSISGDGVGLEFYKKKCKFYRISPKGRIMESLQLQTLNLKSYYLNTLELCSLFETLTVNQRIETLILSNVPITKDAAKYLLQVFETNKTIQKVDLSRCSMASDILKILVPGIKFSRSIRELNVGHNNLGCEGMEHVAEIMAENFVIRTLNLSHNSFGNDSLPFLKIIFDKNIMLQDLDLSWNTLNGSSVFLPTMKALNKNSEIRRLNMAWNQISEKKTIEGLAAGLAKNSTLQWINLSNNSISGSDNIKCLCNAILQAHNLYYANFGFNPISSKQALMLINVLLENNHVFDNLNLCNVWLEPESAKALKKMRSKKFANKILIYGGNYDDWSFAGPTENEIMLKRAQYLAAKPKRLALKRNFLHFLILLNVEEITCVDFVNKLVEAKIRLDQDLIMALIHSYACYHDENLINVGQMRDDMLDIDPNAFWPVREKKRKAHKGRRHRKLSSKLNKHRG